MSFIVDKQTLDDLHIFGRFRKDALYNLFNTTQTRGGAQLLEEMFLYPMADGARIRKRSSIIRYFMERNIAFPFQQDAFDAIEHYLENHDDRTQLAAEDDTLQRKLRIYMGADAEFEWLQKGMIACIDVFNTLKDFLQVMRPSDVPTAYSTDLKEMQALLSDEQLTWMLQEKGAKKLTYAKAAKYDRQLRFLSAAAIRKLLQHIYGMDVYIAVAKVAMSKGYVFAEVLEGSSNNIRINGMYHPYLANPVANSLHIDQRSNVIFLTGANMAGKSTFMKTLGITIYLAHMGFPVPAQSMQFTVLQGLFTTINLADNLGMGYSHFYAEVLRLKKIAQQVNRAENILIIFDELFRGTNVKDAYDATVAVTEAFATKQNCTFIISTHIMEAGEELQTKCPNINFVYFPTVLKANKPVYTYQLSSGITSDRHGMMIINNERIIEIIKSRQTSKPS